MPIVAAPVTCASMPRALRPLVEIGPTPVTVAPVPPLMRIPVAPDEKAEPAPVVVIAPLLVTAAAPVPPVRLMPPVTSVSALVTIVSESAGR